MRNAASLAFLLAGPLLPAVAQAAPSGADLYSQNCAACHQADANGVAGQFPPLKNRIDKIAATPEGVRYLADVLTHGMSGAIDIGGDTYVGYMPSFARLKDDDIATILTWLSAQGDSKPPAVIAAADLTAARSHNLTAAGVVAERTALAAQHPLP